VKGILPVRIWGTDSQGAPFAEHVCTVDISNKGASVTGVRACLSPGGTIGLQYRNRQARFQVMWVAPAPASAQGNNVGLQCLQPEKDLWPVTTPTEGEDPYVEPAVCIRDQRATRDNRRVHTRFAVSGTAHVSTVNGGQHVSATVGDLSLTGCYLLTDQPMHAGRSVSLLLSIGDHEFQAAAIVRSCYPGLAMGLEFTFLSSTDRSTLRALITRLKEMEAVAQ
jgi:PilZ domain